MPRVQIACSRCGWTSPVDDAEPVVITVPVLCLACQRELMADTQDGPVSQ